MRRSPASAVRLLGIVSGAGVASFSLLYALVLTAGLATLPAANAPIGDPWFSAMEALILLLVPFLLGLAVAVRDTGLAPRATRSPGHRCLMRSTSSPGTASSPLPPC